MSNSDFKIKNGLALGKGPNYAGFKAPAELPASVTWTLPSSDGTANQVLKTDGNKNLAFVDAGQKIFNGLEDGSKFSLSYEVSTRILTVTYTSGAALWVNGVRYSKSGSEQFTAHDNTSGKYYFYYDSTGAKAQGTAAWDIAATAQLAAIYYNATLASAILIDERHPAASGMPEATHSYLHKTFGTQTVSGFAISGYTPNTSGAEALSYAIASGVIADEDLQHTVTAVAEGGPYRILWRSGSGGEWTWSDTSTTGILDNGTDIYYNQLTGGAWQRTAITNNNNWVNYYVAVIPEYSKTKQIVVIMGQATYGSLSNAQAESPATAISGLSNLTDEFVYLYRITYRRGSGWSPSNAQIASVQGIRSNTISVTGGFNASDHQALSNRDATNAHPASAIGINASSFSGILSGTDIDGQTALNTLDAHKHYSTATFSGTTISPQTSGTIQTQTWLYTGESAQTLTSFGTLSNLTNGMRITLMGSNDTNTISLSENDAANGWIINGAIELYRGSSLTLEYNSTLERLVEIART